MSWKTTLTSPQFLETIQLRMAVKAGLAATLGLFFGVGFSQVLDRPDSLVSGLWTVITAIVVVQAYLGGTYQAAWIRFLGTFIGSVIGCVCAIIFGSNALSLGFSVFCTVAVCSALNLKDSVRIASISVAVLIVFWGLKPDISPWTFAFFRFMDSCVGILIAVVVAHTVWPTQATKKVRLNIVVILRNLRQLLHVSVRFDSSNSKQVRGYENTMRETVELMRQTRMYLDESRIEIRTRSSLRDWIYLLEHLEDAYDVITNLHGVNKGNLKSIFDQQISQSTHECICSLDKAFEELSETLQERHVIGQPVNVLGALEKLQEDLQCFREMQITKKLPIEDAENFFVFFYSLKALADEVIKIDTKIHNLYH
jgi:uncharacterized membrane protein YgaE (UPF0421/DUF939 family)